MSNQAKIYYKVVHDTGNKETYQSSWAGHGVRSYPGLNYNVGTITTAPLKSQGIFIWDNLESAQLHASDTRIRAILPVTILIVYPIGEVKPEGSTLPGCYTCPSVFVVGQVTTIAPWAPKFKVGDRVVINKKTVKEMEIGVGGDHFLTMLGTVMMVPSQLAQSYEVVFTNGCGQFIHEPDLDLAPPEPVWVDVTEECTVSKNEISDHMLCNVAHNGNVIACFGLKGAYIDKYSEQTYRIEKATKTSQDCWWFRVMMKKEN